MSKRLERCLDNDWPICGDCALKNGATWPKNHSATFWVGECSVCDKKTTVCAASDYNWPQKDMSDIREF